MLGTGQAHADKIVQSQTQPDNPLALHSPVLRIPIALSRASRHRQCLSAICPVTCDLDTLHPIKAAHHIKHAVNQHRLVGGLEYL